MAEKLADWWRNFNLPVRIGVVGVLVCGGIVLMSILVRNGLWRVYQASYEQAQGTVDAMQEIVTQQAHELADLRATNVHFTTDLFVGEGTQPAGETLVAVYEAIAQGPGRFDIQGPVGHTVCDELALNRWGRNPVLYNAGREIRLLDERFVLAGNRLAVFRDELEPVCPDVLDE